MHCIATLRLNEAALSARKPKENNAENFEFDLQELKQLQQVERFQKVSCRIMGGSQQKTGENCIDPRDFSSNPSFFWRVQSLILRAIFQSSKEKVLGSHLLNFLENLDFRFGRNATF